MLHKLRDNPRVLVTGGPGTGKTWLALEQARTWAAAGRRVLVLCYSRGLALWLRAAVAGVRGGGSIEAMTFHEYAVSRGIEVPAHAGQGWWDVEVPELLSGLVTEPTYDALVVDEAQDFADAWWPPLLASLLASLREPRVFAARDDRQALFQNRRGSPDLVFARVTLEENLRNTTQIASVFGPLADAAMRYIGGDGPPVRYVPCSPEAAHDVADAEVARLVGAGHPEGHIALLTTMHRHAYHRSAQDQRSKDFHWEGFWAEDETFYSTVMGFKGLEREAVVLAVDGFHDGVARNVLYAGLSRARDVLVVCGDLDMIRTAGGKEVAKRLAAADRG